MSKQERLIYLARQANRYLQLVTEARKEMIPILKAEGKYNTPTHNITLEVKQIKTLDEVAFMDEFPDIYAYGEVSSFDPKRASKYIDKYTLANAIKKHTIIKEVEYAKITNKDTRGLSYGSARGQKTDIDEYLSGTSTASRSQSRSRGVYSRAHGRTWSRRISRSSDFLSRGLYDEFK